MVVHTPCRGSPFETGMGEGTTTDLMSPATSTPWAPHAKMCLKLSQWDLGYNCYCNLLTPVVYRAWQFLPFCIKIPSCKFCAEKQVHYFAYHKGKILYQLLIGLIKGRYSFCVRS